MERRLHLKVDLGFSPKWTGPWRQAGVCLPGAPRGSVCSAISTDSGPLPLPHSRLQGSWFWGWGGAPCFPAARLVWATSKVLWGFEEGKLGRLQGGGSHSVTLSGKTERPRGKGLPPCSVPPGLGPPGGVAGQRPGSAPRTGGRAGSSLPGLNCLLGRAQRRAQDAGAKGNLGSSPCALLRIRWSSGGRSVCAETPPVGSGCSQPRNSQGEELGRGVPGNDPSPPEAA